VLVMLSHPDQELSKKYGKLTPSEAGRDQAVDLLSDCRVRAPLRCLLIDGFDLSFAGISLEHSSWVFQFSRATAYRFMPPLRRLHDMPFYDHARQSNNFFPTMHRRRIAPPITPVSTISATG
jgi:hypothetical protein